MAGTNRLGFFLHVAAPAEADRAVFGAVPTVWLPERLVDGSDHWYDAVAALVYVTHHISLPLLTGVVWFCVRERFRSWLATVLVLTVVGIGGYVVHPAALPWIALGAGRGRPGRAHLRPRLGTSCTSTSSGTSSPAARTGATLWPPCPRCTPEPPRTAGSSTAPS